MQYCDSTSQLQHTNFYISQKQYDDLRADADNAKPDVVITSLRLESQPEGGPAGPAIVRPGAAAAHARYVASPILLRRGLGGIQVGIGAAGQLSVVPIPAPLEDIAVHIVQAPRVGRVAADLGGTT